MEHVLPRSGRVRVRLTDVLLGPGPSLHHLRDRHPCRLCSAASLVLCPSSTPRRCSRPDCAFGFPARSTVSDGYRRGLSVLARAVSRRAHGSWTTPGLTGTRDCVPASVAFPLQAYGRRPNCAFRSSIPGPSMPLSMLHPAPHGAQRKTRGQDGSLLLSCGALSSPTARRFIPTIASR